MLKEREQPTAKADELPSRSKAKLLAGVKELEPRLVLPPIAVCVGILLSTLVVSGIENIDPLVSLFGSFLGASTTIAAFVSIFVSWVVERRINRGLDVFDEIEENKWKDLTPEQSYQAFGMMKQKYHLRYESAKVPGYLRTAITFIYVPCLAVAMLSFFFIGYMLDIPKLGQLGFIVYVTVSFLTVVSLFAFGILLSDLMSLEKGALFILPDPKELNSSGFLKRTFALDFRIILARIGFVRVRATLKKVDECHLLVERVFKDLETDYEVVFETEGKKKTSFRKRGSFRRKPKPESGENTCNKSLPVCGQDSSKKDYEYENGLIVIKGEDFPPIFQGTPPWTLRIELKGLFPPDFYEKGRDGKPDYSKPLFFEEVRYVFEEKTRPKGVLISIGFKMREATYLKPQEQFEDFFLKKTWKRIRISKHALSD